MRLETGRHKGLPFIMDKVRPVDLFPGTKHCELVVLFKREETTSITNNPEAMAREDTATGSTQGVPESAAVLPGEPNLSLYELFQSQKNVLNLFLKLTFNF
ncbi:tRNA (uracil-5-)-methyltransferase A [Biomphalaria pfeifferi]|uniref:tRNA (Uracil-5-)-methyltransferase A n=1 Tax=Biomphalaria pfeifferi TaxID=112525 RepID=A0AAD8F4M0_BIOPF|nr:tRNA (uracil-5-)-methyltransferase A [Biomphalaria pfeifferi]